MTIETIFGIVGAAFSFGGLVALFVPDRRRRQVVLAVVLAALMTTSGLALYYQHEHRQDVGRVESRIIGKLSHNSWTFEQIYEALHFPPFPVVNEALFRAIKNGIIEHEVREFQTGDGDLVRVRVYYVTSTPANPIQTDGPSGRR